MTLKPENIAERIHHVCASELAAVLGLSPWETAQEVWSRKVGETSEKESNDDMEDGNAMEQAILSMAQRRIGITIQPNSDLMICKEHQLLAATPDGIGVNGRPLFTVQAKTLGHGTIKDWADPDERPDGIPTYIVPQVVCEMASAGLTETPCLVAAYYVKPVRLYRVAFDRELWEAILPRVEAFWQCVVKQTPPPVVDYARGHEWIKSHYKQQSQTLRKLSPEEDHQLAQWMAKHEQAKLAKISAEVEQEECAARIKEAIGTDAGIEGDRWSATWKASKDTQVVDWKQVAERAGASKEDIDASTTIKPGARRFLLKVKI